MKNNNCLIGIYCWRNIINNKVYIGSSKDLNERFYDHLFNKSSNIHLQRSITKYGIENFEFSILEFINIDLFQNKIEDTKKKILEREQYYLDYICKASENNYKFKSISYNINRKAESCLGAKRTEEQRKNYSAWQKGRKLSDKHKNNIKLGRIEMFNNPDYLSPLKGKKISDSHINKIIQSKLYLVKKIIQYDLEGNFIKEWDSIKNAQICLGLKKSSSLSRCAGGHLKTACGYIWRYKEDENIPQKIDTFLDRKIKVYDRNMNYLGIFNNCFQIEKILNINHTVVSNALKKLNKKSKKYYFEYVDIEKKL